jgi:hypothetical protein
MKNVILGTLMVAALWFVTSAPAYAGDGSTLRVVAVETSNPQAYAEEIKKGRAIIAKVDPKFTLRAWRGTFAGDRTGAIAVAVEYPGDFAAFATAWTRLTSDKAVSDWLNGLSGLRTIASDSLYQEIGL